MNTGRGCVTRPFHPAHATPSCQTMANYANARRPRTVPTAAFCNIPLAIPPHPSLTVLEEALQALNRLRRGRYNVVWIAHGGLQERVTRQVVNRRQAGKTTQWVRVLMAGRHQQRGYSVADIRKIPHRGFRRGITFASSTLVTCNLGPKFRKALADLLNTHDRQAYGIPVGWIFNIKLIKGPWSARTKQRVLEAARNFGYAGIRLTGKQLDEGAIHKMYKDNRDVWPRFSYEKVTGHRSGRDWGDESSGYGVQGNPSVVRGRR